MAYNATVYETQNGEDWGVFTAEVATINGRLQMLRSNSVQCTGYEGRVLKSDIAEYNAKAGDAAYEVYLRACHPDSEYRIVQDDCHGYKNRLAGLNLPPAYKI